MLPTLKSTRRVGIEAPESIEIPSTNLLPKQPGNNWDDVAFKKKHARSQGLHRELMGDTGKVYQQTHVKIQPPQQEQYSEKVNTLLSCLSSSQPLTQEDDAKALRDLDSKVLRYYGYWREASVESAHESTRIRKVSVCVFPHDETVMVLEPRVPNSGFQGGTLVKRHRIPAGIETARKRNHLKHPERRIPAEDIPEGEEHLVPNDFAVGDDVTIYGKCIRIVDCDAATRQFLEALGSYVADPEDYPSEEYTTDHKVPAARQPKSYSDFDLRKTFEHSANGRVTTYYPNEVKRLKNFLSGEPEVCRFWAFWDDKENPHGDVRNFEIRFHIQDDTTEVLERLPANSGREGSRAFVQRRKIPRNPTSSTDLTFASRSNGYRYEAPTGDAKEEEFFYNILDFQIGQTIKVYGRELCVYKADSFTRAFFSERLNIEMKEDKEVDAFNQKEQKVVIHPPKHNGFGTEEDSLGNCKSLVLRAPKQNIKNWQKHADTLLRFKMMLHNPSDSNDLVRRFILTFYVGDGTLMVNEVSVRNTGFLAGRFLKRQKVKKYAGEGESCLLKDTDIDVGEVLKIMGHTFEIIDMDEFTQKYKKGEREVVPASDVTSERVKELAMQLRSAIMAKHVTLTEAFRHYDTDRDGALPLHEVEAMFKNLNIRCEPNELIRIIHHFGTNGDAKLSLNEFVAGITGNTVKSILDGDESEYGKPTQPPLEEEQRCRELAGSRPNEVLREKVLRVFKEKMEGRQINVFEMFRTLSTMPSSHRRNTRDVAALGSGGSDGLLGPVQLRRGIEERFSFGFKEEEVMLLMEFFFPTLPKSLYNAPREETVQYRLALPKFQERWAELERLGQLKPDMSLKG